MVNYLIINYLYCKWFDTNRNIRCAILKYTSLINPLTIQIILLITGALIK